MRKIEIDKEELENLYTEKKLPARKCAEILECSDGTILNRLHELKIIVRDLSVSHKGNHYPKISKACKGRVSGNKGKKGLFKHTKEWKKQMSKFLTELYASDSQPFKMGFKKGHIPWNKNTKGLVKPNSGCFKKGVSYNKGEKNGMWKGGISDKYKLHLSQRKWIKLTTKIRKGDNYICQQCGCSPASQVHHIIPWRLTHNDNPNNLITLCRNCHSRVDNTTKFKVISNVCSS